jgi:predicted RNA-binding Zn-ribbon protein involved in translation (DUF1610 family)
MPLVTCNCTTCSGHIEFDSVHAGQTVTCPHCGIETVLYVVRAVVAGQERAPFALEPAAVTDHAFFDCSSCQGEIAIPHSQLESAKSVSFSCPHCGQRNSFPVYGIGKYGKEELEAIRWAAEQGDAGAQDKLGVYYSQGYGVQRDFAEAEKWIRLSAEQGNPSAQYHLGNLLHLSRSEPRDPIAAFEWWLKAANQGHAIAQNNVGYLYEEGGIIEQDLVKAYKWMRMAADQSLPGAAEHCGMIAAKMSETQRRECERQLEALGMSGSIEMPRREERQAIPSEVRREVWRRDQGKCVKCGSRERLEYDHIVPVSKGGSNTARNVELLCEACNRAKSDSIE